MGTLASGSIDLKSLKVAGSGATSYITKIDNNGIKIHAANNVDLNYTQITSEGMEIFKTDGAEPNPSAISVAKFGQTSIIGRPQHQSYIKIDYHSLEMIDKEGDTYFYISDLRDADGYITDTFIADTTTESVNTSAALSSIIEVKIDEVLTTQYHVDHNIAEDYSTIIFNNIPSVGAIITVKYVPRTVDHKAFTLGQRAQGKIGSYSVAEGIDITASGTYSHAEGRGSIASGRGSHAEGYPIYDNGVACYTTASGTASHAEGYGSIASGGASHAEGITTLASGESSHSEGWKSIASGMGSHAQGYNTIASGDYSYSGGVYTIAQRWAQTAIGEFNKADIIGADYAHRGKYAFIIGNGVEESDRSNAFAVSWEGDITVANHLTAIGYTNNDSGSIKINSATSPYTPAKLSGAITLSTGTYVLMGEVSFPGNATGIRHIEWKEGANENNASTILSSRITTSAAPAGAATKLQSIVIVNVTGSSQNYYLYCYHTSGVSQMEISYYWHFIRIT